MTDNQLSLLFLNTYDVFWWCILCAWCIIYHDIVYNSNIIFLRIIYVTVISIVHDKLFGPYNKWTKIFFKFCFLFIIYCPTFLLRKARYSTMEMTSILFIGIDWIISFCVMWWRKFCLYLKKCSFIFVNYFYWKNAFSILSICQEWNICLLRRHDSDNGQD